MLSYLVPSDTRRRLLVALWEEHAKGTASELAAVAHVSFATAFRELRAMFRHGLASAEVVDGLTRYTANRQHPLSPALDALVRWRGTVPAPVESDRVRAQLAELGAPLRSESEPLRSNSLEEDVVRGALLARRDPATARAMPVLLHKLRDQLDPARLTSLAREHAAGHTLGFLLALTAKLAGDRRLASTARSLRDRRVHDQPFFVVGSSGHMARFPLAAAWGFRMSTDEAAFRSTFDRFAKTET